MYCCDRINLWLSVTYVFYNTHLEQEFKFLPVHLLICQTAVALYGGTFEIRGNSKFGVIYVSHSFSFYVKCFEKF